METDIYKTIRSSTEGLYKEKGSKFIACAYPVADENQIYTHIDRIKKQFYDARHHCYAWQLGTENSHYRINDDGEPSGTAGKPIYGQILSNGLTNILIVVVRYFGGIKLGTSGLIAAYKASAADALANSEIIDRYVQDYYQIHFNYEAMNDVMRILKDEQPNIFNQSFDLRCTIELSQRSSKSNQLIQKLESVTSVKTIHVKRE